MLIATILFVLVTQKRKQLISMFYGKTWTPVQWNGHITSVVVANLTFLGLEEKISSLKNQGWTQDFQRGGGGGAVRKSELKGPSELKICLKF